MCAELFYDQYAIELRFSCYSFLYRALISPFSETAEIYEIMRRTNSHEDKTSGDMATRMFYDSNTPQKYFIATVAGESSNNLFSYA